MGQGDTQAHATLRPAGTTSKGAAWRGTGRGRQAPKQGRPRAQKGSTRGGDTAHAAGAADRRPPES